MSFSTDCREILLAYVNSRTCFVSIVIYTLIQRTNLRPILYCVQGRLNRIQTFILAYEFIHEDTNYTDIKPIWASHFFFVFVYEFLQHNRRKLMISS